MEFKPQVATPKVKPRIIIHGGAGNITPANLPPRGYHEYRITLLGILSKTHAVMNTPRYDPISGTTKFPSALNMATYAVVQLEDNPLFNSAHGAVFTRDGINQLEASVMVSRGYKKRGVGVMGIERVKNPIMLAAKMLAHGEQDMGGSSLYSGDASAASSNSGFDNDSAQDSADTPGDLDPEAKDKLDVPSAQFHTLIYGEAAEILARKYGLELVDRGYFFTQRRWEEHRRALERERNGQGLATWSQDEYLPQGTCGAVALDDQGVVCCATSTGGLTNKLTGRIGDTPVVGAGFWAEEWEETGDPTSSQIGQNTALWERMQQGIHAATDQISFAGPLKGLLADCLPTPWMYAPVAPGPDNRSRTAHTTTRSMAASGTGNGDSFLRVAAVRTVAAIARWKPAKTAEAIALVSGPGGELQRSAGNRWGVTGEGEGGMIGIESVVVRDDAGEVIETRGEVVQAHNCGGMFRAWIDDSGKGVFSVFREDEDEDDEEKAPIWAAEFEGVPISLDAFGEKTMPSWE